MVGVSENHHEKKKEKKNSQLCVCCVCQVCVCPRDENGGARRSISIAPAVYGWPTDVPSHAISVERHEGNLGLREGVHELRSVAAGPVGAGGGGLGGIPPRGRGRAAKARGTEAGLFGGHLSSFL